MMKVERYGLLGPTTNVDRALDRVAMALSPLPERVRDVAMPALGIVAEAVDAGRRAQGAASTARAEVADLRGRLALALDEADGWRRKLEAAQDELAATQRALEAAEEALSARVGA